jgi:LPXTG-motif cell wall-anchored protein
MRRLVAVFLALSMLALPSAAAAQSAGDEQYADPFGQTEQPNESQDQPAPEPQPAPAPATPAAPAEQAVASQQTAAPTLPATGMPAHLLASMGALLLASGALLRRRAL